MSRIIARYTGGFVTENDNGYRVFVKFVKRERHFMRKNRSWGISLAIVQELNRLGTDSIELHITDENEVLFVDMETFNAKSSIESYNGNDEQAFLFEGFWAVMG